MRVGFHTFGCKLNQFESEALASALRSKGCQIVRAEQAADAYARALKLDPNLVDAQRGKQIVDKKLAGG